MTERLLMGRKESNQTKSNFSPCNNAGQKRFAKKMNRAHKKQNKKDELMLHIYAKRRDNDIRKSHKT